MDKGRVNWVIIFGIIGVLLLIIAASVVINAFKKDKYDELAKCLTAKGFTEYGTYWCGNCERQKLAFGGSYKYINYVECDEEWENAKPEECDAKGITGYPTWITPDGEQIRGFQSMENLARVSGCELPG